MHTFVNAVDSPGNVFFDVVGEDTFLRAAFIGISPLLALPSQTFGSPEELLPFIGTRHNQDNDEDVGARDLVFEEVPDDPEGGDTLIIAEIGHFIVI